MAGCLHQNLSKLYMVNSVDLKDGLLFSVSFSLIALQSIFNCQHRPSVSLSFFWGKEGVLSVVLCRV